MRRTTCFLCQRELQPHPFVASAQIHPVLPEAERDCLVEYTDAWGVAIETPDVEASARAPVLSTPEPGEIIMTFYPFVDVLMEQFFAERGLPRLGGKSTGRGWSSFALWQRCAYAWKRRYLDAAPPMIPVESPSLAIGSLVHAHLALYYAQLIGDSPYQGILPEQLHDALLGQANPEFLNEAWRVFSAYKLYYHFEEGIQPLAIEFDLRDPRNGESCRYDMIAFQPEQISNRPPGTYIWEHKCLVGSSMIFDGETGALSALEGRPPGRVQALTSAGGLEPAISSRAQSNGVREIFRLVTDHGRVLEGSGNHPIWTLEGWRQLDELDQTDWVAVPRRLGARSRGSATHRDDEVALLGYLLGDGSLGEPIRFSKSAEPSLTRVSELARRLGWRIAHREPEARCTTIDFLGPHSEGAYALIDSLGLRGLHAAEKFVPHERLTLGTRQVWLLLGALLDTDGSVDAFHDSRGYFKPRIAYVSRSRALAFDVLFLFDRLGIEASCRESSVEYKSERRAVWTTKVVGRAAKRRVLDAIIRGHLPAPRLIDAAKHALGVLEDVDDEAVPCAWIRKQRPIESLDARLRMRIKASRSIGLGYLAQFDPALAEAYMAQAVRWERVETIMAAGRAEVFNIEVKEHHTFVANGIVTHNTAGRFDDDTLTGWVNDGEILGEVMLWRRLGLDKRFGELRGVVVNILGKQPKNPKFHREYVAPSSLQLEQHKQDLKHHEGLIQLARSTGIFPRSRNNCIGRWGRCDRWEECALTDQAVNLMIPDGR